MIFHSLCITTKVVSHLDRLQHNRPLPFIWNETLSNHWLLSGLLWDSRWSNLKTNRSDTYNPTNSATSHWWLWDWAHSMSLRKVSSLYAGDNALLCRHWVAKTCTLSISTSLALVVGVSTGLILSLFISTSSWKAKSGSLPSPPADFALNNPTNRTPEFLASKRWSRDEPLHTWMLLRCPQSSLGVCGLLFPMPVAMEPADACIGMPIQWNDLPLQLAQLLDLH